MITTTQMIAKALEARGSRAPAADRCDWIHFFDHDGVEVEVRTVVTAKIEAGHAVTDRKIVRTTFWSGSRRITRREADAILLHTEAAR